MQRKIRLMIGILIMTGLIAGCWKVSKNLQKELKEEMDRLIDLAGAFYEREIERFAEE